MSKRKRSNEQGGDEKIKSIETQQKSKCGDEEIKSIEKRIFIQKKSVKNSGTKI